MGFRIPENENILFMKRIFSFWNVRDSDGGFSGSPDSFLFYGDALSGCRSLVVGYDDLDRIRLSFGEIDVPAVGLRIRGGIVFVDTVEVDIDLRDNSIGVACIDGHPVCLRIQGLEGNTEGGGLVHYRGRIFQQDAFGCGYSVCVSHRHIDGRIGRNGQADGLGRSGRQKGRPVPESVPDDRPA